MRKLLSLLLFIVLTHPVFAQQAGSAGGVSNPGVVPIPSLTSNTLPKASGINIITNSDLTNPSSNVINIGATGGVYQIDTDTALSRVSAGVFGVGTGAQGSVLGQLLAANLGNVYFASSYCTPSGNNCPGGISGAMAVAPAGAAIYVATNVYNFTETTGTTDTFTVNGIHLICSNPFSPFSITWDSGNHPLFQTLNSTTNITGGEIAYCNINETHALNGSDTNFIWFWGRGVNDWDLHDNQIQGTSRALTLSNTSRDNKVHHNWFLAGTDGALDINGNTENITFASRATTTVTITLGNQSNARVGDNISVYGLTVGGDSTTFNCSNVPVLSVVTGATPQITYTCGNGNVGNTAVTCTNASICAFVDNADDNYFTENTVTGQVDSGLLGPPHFLTSEDANNTHACNNTMLDYALFQTTANSSFIQNFQNHSFQISGNDFCHETLVEIPAAPTGKMNGIVIESAGTYVNETVSDNTMVGVATGISSTSIQTITAAHYHHNTCVNCNLGATFQASALTNAQIDFTDFNMTGASGSTTGGYGVQIQDICKMNLSGINTNKTGGYGLVLQGACLNNVQNVIARNPGQAGTTNAEGVFVGVSGSQKAYSNNFTNILTIDDQLSAAGGVPTMQNGFQLTASAIDTHLCNVHSSGAVLRNGDLSDAGVGTVFDCGSIQKVYGKMTIVSATTTSPTPVGVCTGSASVNYTYEFMGIVGGSSNTAHIQQSATDVVSCSSTLNATNFITIPCPVTTAGIDQWQLFRTASAGTPASTGYITTCRSGDTVIDSGYVIADATLPANGNTTGVLDASAGSKMLIPVVAAGTSGSDGQVVYDSTNTNTHIRTNGADSIAAAEAAALAANTIPKATDATHGLLAASSLTDNATTIASTETLTIGTAAGSPGITDKTIGYNTAAMGAQSTATCTAITGMTWNLAANKRYLLQCKIPVTLAATATIQFCLKGPGTATSYSLEANGDLGTAGVWSQISTLAQTVWDGTIKTNASAAVAATSVVNVTAGIQNGATASGTALTLNTAADGTHNITVLADAWCTLTGQN